METKKLKDMIFLTDFSLVSEDLEWDIVSTHSPFLLSLPGAKIFNMDSEPVKTCKWTELLNVRIFFDFFQGEKG